MSGPASRLHAWRTSAQFRAIARAQCAKMNAEHALRPRCGATRKYDGQPCTKPAMANGKCPYHGGKTPKGAAWHKARWPNRNSPDLEPKLASKLKALAKRKRAKSERLARRTPEEQAAHQAWQKSHKPGDPKARARDREQRRQDLEARKVLSVEPKTTSTVADRGKAAPRTTDFQQSSGPGAFG